GEGWGAGRRLATPEAGLMSPVEDSPCLRLFHSTGDVGCRGPRRLRLPIYSVQNAEDIQDLENLTKFNSVAVVLPASMLNATTLSKLEATTKLGGVIVIDGPPPDCPECPHEHFSQDGQTPGAIPMPILSWDGDFDPLYTWNTHGNSLLQQSRSYPMTLITDSLEQGKAEAWGLANHERLGGAGGPVQHPIYMAQMSYYFGKGGRLTSISCLNWKDVAGHSYPQCLPIGGHSVWGVAGLVDSTKPLVLGAAGLDSASIFPSSSGGVNSAASGAIAVLAAADAIRASGVHVSALPRQIGFAMFQAEAWGLTGSRRFAKDALSGEFKCHNQVPGKESPSGEPMCLNPLYPSLEFSKLGKLSHTVVIDQVGITGDSHSTGLFLHTSSKASGESTSKVLTAGANGGKYALRASSPAPSSLPSSPLRALSAADRDMEGFVIAGYNSAYIDPLYHSHFK
ncbi:unnamed protein product, partial [Chrysoparadoxa australica]